MTAHPEPRPATAADDNLPTFSVGEISQALKRTVEGAYAYVRVRGEVSGLKRHGSGHMYFALKDEIAVLDGVCWRGSQKNIRFRPEDGLEVVCVGRLTTYPGRSKYQIVVERMEPAGAGALMALLEERKRKLAAEGLFDADRKRPLPYLPDVVGVVTSPTGAVIRDILHRLADRFPRRVLLWPVRVQGDTAAGEVAAAIRGFNALTPGGEVPRPDVLIVARGGGSLEDLWPFNDEDLVRAAAASGIPLISAVGHETDTTLIDLASDRRAPTPTAAAEMAVPVRAEIALRLRESDERLLRGVTRVIEYGAREVGHLARGLPDPQDLINRAGQRLDDRAERLRPAAGARLSAARGGFDRLAGRVIPPTAPILLGRSRVDAADGKLGTLARVRFEERRAGLGALGKRLTAEPLWTRLGCDRESLGRFVERADGAALRRINDARARLASACKLLESFGYRNVLGRGFALVRDADGRPVTSTEGARHAVRLEVEFADGSVTVRPEGAPPGGRRRTGPEPAAGEQKRLF